MQRKMKSTTKLVFLFLLQYFFVLKLRAESERKRCLTYIISHNVISEMLGLTYAFTKTFTAITKKRKFHCNFYLLMIFLK